MEGGRARGGGGSTLDSARSVVERLQWSYHLPVPHFSLLVFTLCLHDGHMDSVKKASPNMGRLFRTHRPNAQMSAMRMDRDRKSWHSWQSSSADRRSAARAMIRDVERGQHWTVIFLLSLALQPQVSR